MHRVQVTRLSWRELDDIHPSGRRELEKVKKKRQKKSKSNNSIIKKTKTLGEEWVKSHPGQVCQRRADI